VERGLKPGEAFVSPIAPSDLTIEHYQLANKIVNFRNRYHGIGHFQADLDPLGIKHPKVLPTLTPEAYGLTEEDMGTDIRFMKGMLDGTVSSVTVCVLACLIAC
jgi:2-oxoglutarate dehydrogenase complex dehydrogenase (E1) component-like enzyme